jgi:hypothetical protein
VPVNATLCGLLLALSAIVSVPLRVPTAVGRKATLITQDSPVGKTPPQVVERIKSPVIAMLLIASGSLPEFFKLMLWAELAVSINCTPKLNELFDRLTAALAKSCGVNRMNTDATS